jgi:pyridoxine 5'-phosphate synthase PdxJ
VGDAIFMGLDEAVRQMRAAMDAGREGAAARRG